MSFSCRNCTPPKRFPGCHSQCPEYLAEKEQYEKDKAIRDKQKYISDGLTDYEIKRTYKAVKINRRMKGKCHG